MWWSAARRTQQWEGGEWSSELDMREHRLLAWGAAAACRLGQCIHALGMHHGKRERSGHGYGSSGRARRKKWRDQNDFGEICNLLAALRVDTPLLPWESLLELRSLRWLSGSCRNPRRRLGWWRSAPRVLSRRGANKFGPQLPHSGRAGRSHSVGKLCWTLTRLPVGECETNKRQLMGTNLCLKELSTDVFKTQLWKTGVNISSNKSYVEWQPRPTQLIKAQHWDTHVWKAINSFCSWLNSEDWGF